MTADNNDASCRRSHRALTVPFGRQGTGWEVAYAALFLISNESSYVNAHTLFMDCGIARLGGNAHFLFIRNFPPAISGTAK